MKITKSFLLVGSILTFAATSSFAGTAYPVDSCDPNSMTLNYIQESSDNGVSFSDPTDDDDNTFSLSDDSPLNAVYPSGEVPTNSITTTASTCIGPRTNPTSEDSLGPVAPNLGYDGSGLLNTESTDGSGLTTAEIEFLLGDNSDWLDLDGEGLAPGVRDAGWIHLANIQVDEGSSTQVPVGTAEEGGYATVATVSLEPWLNILFECTDEKCANGSWAIEVVEGTADEFSELISATFDHLTFTMKGGSGNQDNGWYIYDFDFTGAINDGLVDTLTDYTFGGTFNFTDLDGLGLSHLNVWARDPRSDISEVPLPGAVWLFGSALLGFAGFKRFNRKS